MDVGKFFLDLFQQVGANVVLPIIMFVLGLVIGLKPGKALGAGLLLGVAFTGMFTFFGLAFSALPAAGQAMVTNAGLKFTAYDFGWTVASLISWAWPLAIWMFPLQILLNIIFLALGWTKCLNVDMWNVWHKPTLAAFTQAILAGSLGMTTATIIGFVVAGAWMIMEFISADYTREQVYNLTRIPGIAVSHNMLFDMIWMSPVLDLIDRIPGLDKIQTNPADLRRRLGPWGENYVIGAILGLLFGILAGYYNGTFLDAFAKIGTLIIQCATIITLFPLIAGLFARALAPISEQAQVFMSQRFPGRTFYVGLDWPVLAGIDALWVTGILLAPVCLAWAFILEPSGINKTLPFASIIVVSLVATVTVLTQGDIVKSFILGTISMPVYLAAATYFAPYFTQLAVSTGVMDAVQAAAPAGLQGVTGDVTWLEMNAAGFRMMVFSVLDMLNGKILPGVVFLVLIPVLGWYYFRSMRRRERIAAEKSGGISGTVPYMEEAKPA